MEDNIQTFLPYPDFKQSLECLDNLRLGKQRVEAFQILRIITGEAEPSPITGKIGWINHPIVRMWDEYDEALTIYYNLSLELWCQRKRRDGKPCQNVKLHPRPAPEIQDILLPPWFGFERFHSSHRSRLLAKDFDFYSQYGWTDDPSADYIWPEG